MERVSVARRMTPRRVGRLGLRELLEPQVRRLVAELLAVREEWLTPDVSLVQDLAADSLDVTELVVEAERRFGVVIPEATISGVHTYGDLVDVVVEARLGAHALSVSSVFMRAAVSPGRRDGRGMVTRSAWLSPYAVETIAADARRAGPGTRLEITVPASAPLAAIERVEQSFAHLASLGITVDVQHEQTRQGKAASA